MIITLKYTRQSWNLQIYFTLVGLSVRPRHRQIYMVYIHRWCRLTDKYMRGSVYVVRPKYVCQVTTTLLPTREWLRTIPNTKSATTHFSKTESPNPDQG
jgi:hypothetical protein